MQHGKHRLESDVDALPSTMDVSILERETQEKLIAEMFVHRNLTAYEDPDQALQMFRQTRPLLQLQRLLNLLDTPRCMFSCPPEYRYAPTDAERKGDVVTVNAEEALVPMRQLFRTMQPWESLKEDAELKVMPCVRPPFTTFDEEWIKRQPNLSHMVVLSRHNNVVMQNFFRALVDLLQHPNLLTPGQWSTGNECLHMMWRFQNMKQLFLHFAKHGTLKELFVLFRVLNRLLRRQTWEDTSSSLMFVLKSMHGLVLPPRRAFLVFLAYYAAAWNFVAWNAMEAWRHCSNACRCPFGEEDDSAWTSLIVDDGLRSIQWQRRRIAVERQIRV